MTDKEEEKLAPNGKKYRPMVWRKMNTMEYYPGQYSCSEADFLHFTARFEYVIDFKEEGAKPYIRIHYSIGGDRIGELSCTTIEEALVWVKQKLENAIKENLAAMEAGESTQIEDTR